MQPPLPRTAYILLWFPVSTETFIFREVENLGRFGLPVIVYTLYGERQGLGREMASWQGPVHRLGLRGLPKMLSGLLHWLRREPRKVGAILRTALFRRWRGVEKTGENMWSLLTGFHLAREFEKDGIEHIHAPWANGPATAAWVAARLTGKPFSFTGRAWDIYPPDALIGVKVSEAALVRTETMANVRHLMQVTGADEAKFRVTYNGVPLQAAGQAELAMRAPFHLLAMGRFVEKKGFEDLVQAVGILTARGVDVRLTLAGDGRLRRRLERLARQLGVADRVHFPGFLPYEAVSKAFMSADVFVMPCVVAGSSDRDGIPTVFLEALLHRVPVVTTAVSGIPELIRHGDTGLVVPEHDPEALAVTLAELLADRARAVELAERGRAQVLRQFDAERNHRDVLALYRRIVQA